MKDLKAEFKEYRFMGMYAEECIKFISSNLKNGNEKELLKFGDDMHHIESNFRTYYAGTLLGFSFNDLDFGKYGWAKIQLMDVSTTEVNNGNKIKVGKGKNGLWVHATSGNFGTAGYGEPLSVFASTFHKSKNDAEVFALKQILKKHKEKLNNTDTTNYKQSFIKKTLKLIELEISKKFNSSFDFSQQQPVFGEQMQLF